MDKISLVLTLKINAYPLGSDLERAKKILLPSLAKYFDLSQISRFWIIVPADEQEQIARELWEFRDRLKITIKNEETLLKSVPGWTRDRIVHGMMRGLGRIVRKLNGEGLLSEYLRPRDGWHSLNGWRRQQILKILAARLVDTDYFLIVDSDLCLMRPANLKTIFPDGKALFGRDRLKTQYDWWAGAARVLGISLKLGPEDEVISVTPQVLVTSVVNRLMDYLMSKAREKGARTLLEYLSQNGPWTEYTLYWLFLLEFCEKGDHYSDQRQGYALHAGGSVWYREQASDARVLRDRIDSAFRRDDSLFLVVQSACIPLSEYYEAVRGHLS
ncbi:MAG: DUF6492 family protein [Candidatus Omnitrophota bacterium]|nr:DUF6492 family protein [Candidatus Omnitrophota bacterium]